MACSTTSISAAQVQGGGAGASPDARARRLAIDEYRILDTPREQNFDDITRLAATIFDTAFAAITFVDDQRAWIKSEVGLAMSTSPISDSFCAHTIALNELMVVADTAREPRFAENPFVTSVPHLRFYAGMPIRAANGTPIAALCVIDPVPRPDGLTGMQRMTLRTLAAQIETQLELRRAIISRDEQAAEERETSHALRFLAEHDTLTGLPNRAVFHEKLVAATGGNDGRPQRTAVMLVDVDHFKQVNDAFGHDAGDALLRAFGTRLRQCLRAADTVARRGGDEFGAILYDIEDDETLAALCASLEDRLREPLEHNGRLIECRASIGIALYPGHADTAEGLIKCADLALGAAKVRRGSIVIFQDDFAEEFERDVTLFAQARSAIADNLIVAGYQPKINLRTGVLSGFEALVRIASGDGFCTNSPMFARAFAHREIAVAIGERMLTHVLDDMRAWRDQGVAFGQIAINSCAADFVANDYAERLLAMLGARDLDPRLIELEVTEGVFLGRGSDHVARALGKLSACGIRIALDDFGTGYASLSHLKRFPIDILKIDQTFVRGVGKNADDTAIVRALVGLGESLGMETVAEGVETAAQAASVRSFGCSTAQGFLYGAACPAHLVSNVVLDLTPPLAA